MFGFFIGAITLFGLMAVLKHRSWHRYHGYGWHGPGPGFRGGSGRLGRPYGDDDRGPDHGPGPGFGRHGGWMLDRLISRINATPEQGKVLRIEVSEFMQYAKGLRSELGTARSDMAQAMRTDSFDETVMGESFARQDDEIRELRKRLVGSLARIHDVLEPEQREEVAELLERGPGFGRRRRGW